MANIHTKSRALRKQIEEHMENNINYQNPNLKKGKKLTFRPPTKEERERMDKLDHFGNSLEELDKMRNDPDKRNTLEKLGVVTIIKYK